MEEESKKPDPSKTALTVTRTEIQTVEKDSLEDEMKSEMMQMAIDGFLNDPNIGKYVKNIKPFIPMGVKQVNKFFGKDQVRIMIYIDADSGAFVFEKVDMDKIDREKLDNIYNEEPNPNNFFIVQKQDLDNPNELIKMITAKLNINIF